MLTIIDCQVPPKHIEEATNFIMSSFVTCPLRYLWRAVELSGWSMALYNGVVPAFFKFHLQGAGYTSVWSLLGVNPPLLRFDTAQKDPGENYHGETSRSRSSWLKTATGLWKVMRTIFLHGFAENDKPGFENELTLAVSSAGWFLNSDRLEREKCVTRQPSLDTADWMPKIVDGSLVKIGFSSF